jgi:hypothetical protein
MFSPVAKVGKDSIELTAKCFHVIVTNVESAGILFSKPKGGRQAGCFRKSNDRLYLEIEDELIMVTENVRRRSWQVNEDSRVPSGRLIFSLSDSRYSSGKIKQWKGDGKVLLESLLPEIVAEVRRYFVVAVRRRAQEAVEREKQAIEWEKRRHEYEKEEAIRREKGRQQKHEEALEATMHAHREDLMKAAEWWRLHQNAVEFIAACEQRWRSAQSDELTAEQRAWLVWARESAKAMSPFETGYPAAAQDGVFDPASVPFGGPYPAKRNFPRPPTMPKMPPPVVKQNDCASHQPEPPPQYPFWLKYQGR